MCISLPSLTGTLIFFWSLNVLSRLSGFCISKTKSTDSQIWLNYIMNLPVSSLVSHEWVTLGFFRGYSQSAESVPIKQTFLPTLSNIWLFLVELYISPLPFLPPLPFHLLFFLSTIFFPLILLLSSFLIKTALLCSYLNKLSYIMHVALFRVWMRTTKVLKCFELNNST